MVSQKNFTVSRNGSLMRSAFRSEDSKKRHRHLNPEPLILVSGLCQPDPSVDSIKGEMDTQ
jgi:hypothetical protein